MQQYVAYLAVPHIHKKNLLFIYVHVCCVVHMYLCYNRRLSILDTDSEETSSADAIPVSASIVRFLLHKAYT